MTQALHPFATQEQMPRATPNVSLRDKWRNWRNGLIGSPGFQRWAARFPLTRPVARVRAQALFDLSAGFVYSQIAYACVTSGLLDRLAQGPQSVAELAGTVGLDEAGAERLAKAAVALKLAETAGVGRFALGVEGAALLGAPGVAAMIEHHRLLYADLADPIALLRRGGGGGALSGYWPYAEGAEGGTTGPYSGLMSASQAMVAAQVLEAYPIGRHQRLMDVGGGDGTFLRAVADHAPALHLSLFDLPPVAERARCRFAAEGRSVDTTGGSFFTDSLPPGADIISLVRILHDHDDDKAMILLRAIRAALEPGRTLLIAEPMAQVAGCERVGDAYFGLYLLAMGSGRPRSVAEIRKMLTAAGFASSREVGTPLPMIASLIIARA